MGWGDVQLISTELKINYKAARNLVEALVIRPGHVSTDLGRLKDRKFIDPSDRQLPLAINVRVAAEHEQPDGTLMGWRRGLSVSEAQRQIGRWWACDHRIADLAETVPVALVPTMAGIVLATYRVSEVLAREGRFLALGLAPPTAAQRRAYSSVRLPSIPGPVCRTLPMR